MVASSLAAGGKTMRSIEGSAPSLHMRPVNDNRTGGGRLPVAAAV